MIRPDFFCIYRTPDPLCTESAGTNSKTTPRRHPSSSAAPRSRRSRPAGRSAKMPSSFFLSLPTSFSRRFTSTGGVRSKPSAVSTFTIRSQSACVSAPSFTAAPAISAVPTATASPWFMRLEAFSMACASVCPRFSLRRSPDSRSSRSTMSALTRIAAETASDNRSVSVRAPRRSSARYARTDRRRR